MTLTEFLLARIAEDEAVARAAIDPGGYYSSPEGRWRFMEIPYEGEWPVASDSDGMEAGSDWSEHCARHDPARVLAECWPSARRNGGSWSAPRDLL